jgi:hypothetical protein
MAEERAVFREYIIAKQALWAGDSAFALRRLEPLLEFPADRTTPESTVAYRARELRKYLQETGSEPAPDAFVVETQLLRGLFARTGERLFEMRAFLLDVDRDKALLQQAHRLMVSKGEQAAGDESSSPERKQWASAPSAGLRRDRTATWTEFREQALVEVGVSEFALVRVQLTWIGRRMPDTLNPIREVFEAVLKELDPEPDGPEPGGGPEEPEPGPRGSHAR